jgi:hypothetical protein
MVGVVVVVLVEEKEEEEREEEEEEEEEEERGGVEGGEGEGRGGGGGEEEEAVYLVTARKQSHTVNLQGRVQPSQPKSGLTVHSFTTSQKLILLPPHLLPKSQSPTTAPNTAAI